MKEELEFIECQRFNKWIAIFLFLVINTANIAWISSTDVRELFNNTPILCIMLIIVTILTFLLSISFFFIRVDTVINRDGVWVRAFPFRLRFKFTPWEHISEAIVRKMNLIRDKRGINFKLVPSRVGSTGFQMIGRTTYNLSGNYVLELTLKNNKKIIIGTQRAEELTAFLEKLNAERKQE